MSGFVLSHQYSTEHYAYVHASRPQQYVFKVVMSPYPDTSPSTPEFIDTPPSSPSSSSHSDEFSSTNDSSRKKIRIPRPLNCYFIFRKDVIDKKMIPKGAEHDSHHLSRIIGQLERHEELYPDYVYQPQRRATELKKRTVKRQSNDCIKRTKDIAHLMSAGMTGSDLKDAVRRMPPIPETASVEPPKKRVSRQPAIEHQFNSSTLSMNSRCEGHFFSATASFKTGYIVQFDILTNGYFDNQSPPSEINYLLAMSSGLYDNTRELNSKYYSSFPTFDSPDTF
ncbi:hypothetical protein EV421DRAFT_1908127 [Armillaria borealis]|uniref:Uncharacterized protein n=1 Tax=Armillaria borealis TaxID=47425 RepID=A0AA39J4Z7_9AGAR|nr:hypothetical protein EV421DRAFT_1908127 [Armillaria borealis]